MPLSAGNETQTFVIFGGTGDLAMRKLLPAVYNMAYHSHRRLSIRVVAIGRRPLSQEAYHQQVSEGIRKFSRLPYDDFCCEAMLGRVKYYQMDMDEPTAYKDLEDFLDELDGGGSRLYYLATSARYFETITGHLGRRGMHKGASGWRRVIIEKPFGSDLETARKLNQAIKTYFDESQVFRIDHYLGKEMTQNILMLRGRNPVFQAVWNNRYIDHIQITVSEDMGVENRAKYYDSSGALRDMIQNHLLQIVALTTMRLCDLSDTESIRNAKVEIFKALKPYPSQTLHEDVVLGQYSGYADIEGVSEGSSTETYVAMRLEVDLEDWSGVPIYIRTGKRLAEKVAYMMVEFKRAEPAPGEGQGEPNRLIVKIQPEEGVSFRFNVKRPGNTMDVSEVEMDFCQTCQATYNSPEAYESLLMDAFAGDQSRFTRWDEVEHAWAFIDQILRHRNIKGEWLETYEIGTWGPPGAERMMAEDERTWWYLT